MANLYNKAGLINIPVGYSDGFLYNIKPTDNTLGFKFDRASAATRVNKEGLIEQVGYFGPELVQNGDFEEIGSELVTNGDFASGTSPFQAYQCNLSNVNNTLVATATSASDSRVKQVITTISGRIYKITADLLSLSGTKVGVTNKDGNSFSYSGDNNERTTSGQFTFFFTAQSTITSIVFKMFDASIGQSFSIDNVSVKEVGQNWQFVGDFETDGTKAFITSASQYSQLTNQTGVNYLLSGNKYRLTFDIPTLSISGAFAYRYTGGSVTPILTSDIQNGKFTTEFTMPSNGWFWLQTTGSYTGLNVEVDNISVVEVLGDKPRIDYTDSLTSPSFLLEPQSTNLITFSEDFTQWNLGSNSTLTYESDVVAPDGSLGVYRLTNPALGATYIQSPSFSSSNPLTVSLYVKSTNSGNDNFNLYTGASNISDLKTATSEWKRFDYTADGSSMYIINSGDTFASDIYIWGAQAEALSYPTSYIPTAGSTVTRAQETCNGAGNASTFNSTEGVLYAEIAALANDLTARVICISDGTNSHRVLILFSTLTNQIQGFHYNGITSSVSLLHTVSDITVFHKIAFKYKLNDFSLWVDGVQVATSSSGGVNIANTFNTLEFQNASGTSDFYGKGKGVYVFNKALTDDELQQLTGPDYNSFAALAAAYNYTVI
jgi:hypothetical protein